MTDKKLTDKDLKKASGAGISAEKTRNREGHEGAAQQSDANTEPNPLPDSKLGQVKGGASISAQKARNREGLEEGSPSRDTSDEHRR